MINKQSQLIQEKVPQHVAIIMDGNGRWAKKHGQERVFGHQNGVESVRSVIEGAAEYGVRYITLYAFSTENWNRPKEEIDALMSLLVKAIENELDKLMKNQVRLMAIGDLQRLPESSREALLSAIETTKNNKGLTVVLALSYSARWEIVEMAKKIAGKAIEHKIDIDDINDKVIAENLSTQGIPDPEVLIRTSGECRISNFLLWQIAYTELFFVDIMWPDFRKENLLEILLQYQTRERRFGKTSAQLQSH